LRERGIVLLLRRRALLGWLDAPSAPGSGHDTGARPDD